MSTIFGAFDRSGRPISPETAVNMRSAMRHWKPDAEGMLLDGDHLLGQCLLFTQSSLAKRDTGLFTIGERAIVADARIHNRKNLLDQLEKSGDRPSGDAHDDELILRWYLAKGWQGLDQIIGDFSLAIFDGRTRELILARDAFGVRPLYWMDRHGHMVFASETRGILAHPMAEPDIDQDFIVRLLAGLPPDPASSFHKHIRILPPGHMLRIGADSISLHRYVEPRIPQRMHRLSAIEAQTGFRSILTEAVRCRIEGTDTIGAELSGGLDSSAITCLAAQLMPDPEKLHVFSNVLPVDHPSELKDESRYMDDVIAHAGIRHVHRISESGMIDFRNALDFDLEVNGGVEYQSGMWLEPFRRRMESKDIRVVLSGFMGDHAVSHSGRNYWTDLADEGYPLRFIAHSLRHRRIDILFGKASKRILPDSWLDLINRMRSGSPIFDSYLRKNVAIPDIVPHRPSKGAFPYKQHLRWAVMCPQAARRLQTEALYGIKHRLMPTYPLADIRLVEWLLSVPVSLIAHPKISRFLFRQSMEGVLPESVRSRMDKDIPAGIYLIEEHRRMNDELRKWVMSFMQQKEHPLLELVDFDMILANLDPTQNKHTWQGRFYPEMRLNVQAYLRYAEKTMRG